MIGKIVSEDISPIFFAPVTKTSQSGLFSNQRLIVLSVKKGIMGYISKVPSPVDTFNDVECLQKCKESVSIRTAKALQYSLDEQQPTMLTISWQDGEQKNWQFKFQTPEIASEWFRYMTEANTEIEAVQEQQRLPEDKPEISNQNKDADVRHPAEEDKPKPVPQKPQRQKIDEKQPVITINTVEGRSPMKQSQQSQIVQGDRQQKQKSFSVPPTPINRLDSPSHKNKSNTFRKFQEPSSSAVKRNDSQSRISTYRQKHGQHPQRSTSRNRAEKINWNVRWWRARENSKIEVYCQFVEECKVICSEIAEELVNTKINRKHIPVKLNSKQETYLTESVEFRLVHPHLLNSQESQHANQQLLRNLQQQVQTHRFVLSATRNHQTIRAPLCCLIKYSGHVFVCQAVPPKDYRIIDRASLTLFKSHILNFQQKLGVRLNREEVHFFCKQSDSGTGRLSDHNFMLLYNIQKILPSVKIHDSTISFYLTSQNFLNSKQPQLPEIAADRLRNDHETQTKAFLTDQNRNCTIISVDDLEQTLVKYKLSRNLVAWIAARTENNKYMRSVLVTEAIAQQIQILLWGRVGQHIKRTANTYQNMLMIILRDLVTKGETWTIVVGQLLEQYELTAKHQELTWGYLFSSVGKKTGADFHYQMLIDLGQYFFIEQQILPQKIIRKIQPVTYRLQPEHINSAEQQITTNLSLPTRPQNLLQQTINFYHLYSHPPPSYLSPYSCRKIYRLMGEFVPFGRQQQFQQLRIFQQEQPEYLDYQIFATTCSAIKWLLVENKQRKAVAISNGFRSDCWFWIGQPNPFAAQLQELIGSYMEKSGRPQQAVQHLQATIDEYGQLLGKGAPEQNLERNIRLAKLLKSSAKHKEALAKLKLARDELYRERDSKKMLLGVLVQMAQLYLHLGSVKKCIQCAREAIEHSVLNPFEDPLQQFHTYECLLRAFEVQEDWPKFKFFLDLLQQKYSKNKDIPLLRQILKYTTRQLLSDMGRYPLKKLVHFLHNNQLYDILQQVQEEDSGVLYLQVKAENEGKCSVFALVRYCLPRVAEISWALSEGQDESQGLLLWKIIKFVGVGYVLGIAVSHLQ